MGEFELINPPPNYRPVDISASTVLYSVVLQRENANSICVFVHGSGGRLDPVCDESSRGSARGGRERQVCRLRRNQEPASQP